MPRPRRYLRNADEGARRRARAAGRGFDQAAIDQSIADKVRNGRADDLTLGELRRASPHLIQSGFVPRGLLELVSQTLFGMLTRGGGIGRVEFRGATISIFEASDEHRIVIMIETGGIEQRFEWPMDKIPILRLWINEQTIETTPSGGLEIDGHLWE